MRSAESDIAAGGGAGVLYLVATPIGNLEDITYRAVRVLGEVDVIAAEDTRRTGHLLRHYQVEPRRLVSFFEGNEASRTDELIETLAGGARVALVSDAGTPGISDPGERLVARAVAAGVRVEVIPGAVAAVAALVGSGLPSERFLFVGFPPRKEGARRELFGTLRREPATLLFYEAPDRVAATLVDLAAALGGQRRAAAARELTKLHEETARGTLDELVERYRATPGRGEHTLVVAGASTAEQEAGPVDLEASVRALLGEGLGPKDVAARLVATTGLPRRRIYQMALALRSSTPPQLMSLEKKRSEEEEDPRRTSCVHRCRTKEEDAMSTDKKKTAAILCAAGALVAAAMLLEKGPAEGKTVDPQPVAGQKPVEPTPVVARCDNDAPARTSADFGRGTLGASLSAGKILRGTGGQVFAAFDLATGQVAGVERPALNVAIVIDRSGSMAGAPLEQAKDAALRFIDRLSERDRMALVQYDDTAQVVVASVALDRQGKDRLSAAVREMTVGGLTNLHGGMTLGRDEVQRTFQSGQVSRVILMSDGKANTGVTDSTEIADAARSAADRGVRITSVGIGLDYNEDLMETIAEAGRGNYYYVRDASGLDPVLAGELASIQGTVATSVELRLHAACDGVEITEVLGYESRRESGDIVIPMADLFGGDSRKLLVQVKVPDRQNGRIGALSGVLSFKDAKSGETKTAQVALALEVTDDHVAVQASVDKDVMAQVLKAQAASSMRQAAQAYEKGDKAGALQILRTTEAKVEMDRGLYGISAGAAAPAMSSLQGMAADAEAFAPGSEGGKDLLKKNKARARDMSKGK